MINVFKHFILEIYDVFFNDLFRKTIYRCRFFFVSYGQSTSNEWTKAFFKLPLLGYTTIIFEGNVCR